MTGKAPPANPVTDKDVLKFDMFMRKWQGLLNLHDWRIVRSSKRAAKGNCAEVKRHLADHLATYYVGMDFGAEPVNDLTLEQIAAHESFHILLVELIETVRFGGSEDFVNAAEHRVINTLVDAFVKKK